MRIDIRVSAEQKEKWQEKAKKERKTLTQFIIDAVEGVHTDIVHTTEKKEKPVHTKKTVVEIKPLESNRSIEARIIGEIRGALELGEVENWKRVKGLIKRNGYEWNITTRELRKGNILVKRF